MSSDSNASSNERLSASGQKGPGTRHHFPIKLTMKCVDKPGDRRGVVILEAPADQGRLVLKIGHPSVYEGFFVGREYPVEIGEGPKKSELVEGEGGAVT